MNAVRLSLTVFIYLFLAACNASSLQTIWKRRNVDLGTVEPTEMRIEINAPKWMEPMLDDLQLAVLTQLSGREATTSLFQLCMVYRPEDLRPV